jgi:glycosyltransferase involved in cell wall biosynthesis
LISLKDKINKSDSVCAVIPFYNEKSTLLEVIKETTKFVDFIFAVNDGSNDDNYETEKNEKDVQFIEHNKNYGKGKALSTGFDASISAGYSYVITIDADLQHNPEYIPVLLDAMKSYDIVVGNRLKDLKLMPLHRRLSNKITTFLLTVKTGQNILDSQCGFRGYSVEVLKNVRTSYNGFEAESEILVKAARKGFNIGFVDIPTIYGNEKSKMRSFQAILGFIKVLFQRNES